MVKIFPTDTGDVVVADLDLLPVCRLKKLSTEDGLFEFNQEFAFVNKLYKYAPKSRRVCHGYNVIRQIEWRREIVLVYDLRGFFGMLPAECLDFNPPGQ